jgi:hypothetical protein
MIDSNYNLKSILQLAEEITSTERIVEYGHPAVNFADIASMWSIILKTDVTPTQVGLCNIATKICREINLHKRDNLVDIAGYAKAIDLVNQYNNDNEEED